MSSDLETNGQKPKRFTGDTGSVEQHDLSDQIELDKYLAGKAAAERQPNNPFAGLRMGKVSHPETR